MATNNKIRFGMEFDVNKTSLNEVKNALQDIRKLTVQDIVFTSKGNSVELLKEQLYTVKKEANDIENALIKAFNPKLNSLNIAKFNDELKKLNIKEIYQDFSKLGPVGIKAFQQIGSSISNSNLQLKQTNHFLDEMAKTMSNTVKWGVTSSIFNNITNSVQKAWDYTKQLDTSLNDIRIVTDKSAESMERFAKQANQAAQGLGKSTKDYTEASLIYYQQGLNDEEVAARTETTLKAANVTGQSGEAVSEQLTAVWNGYKVTAEEAELYVDKLAAVAAATASDLEELSTGMSKVASAADLMGVDVDQLNATLATVISVTRQAPESVGTAFKTIYARMGDIKAGIDEETTLDAYTEQMKSIAGINVLDENNELRDMGEVIEEVGNKWSTYTREQQVALSQAMAGTRQYNNLLSLFDNWDMYNEALATSQNSMGTLQKQQDIYMESTKAHLAQLSTAWERVFDAMVDNESTNSIIDIFTAGTNGIANWIEALGGGGNALEVLGAIGTKVFSKQIAEGIQTTIKNFKAAEFNANQLEKRLVALREARDATAKKDNKGNFLDENNNIIDTSNGQNLDKIVYQDKGSKVRYEETEKMHKYIKSMSEAEIQESQKVIDDYANLVAEKQAYEVERQQAIDLMQKALQEEFVNGEDPRDVIEKNSYGAQNSILNKIQEIEDVPLDIVSDIEINADKIKDIDNNAEKATETFEEWKKSVEGLIYNIKQLAKEDILSKKAKDELNDMADSLEENINLEDGIEIVNSDKTKKEINNAKTALNNTIKELNQDNDIIGEATTKNASYQLDTLNTQIELAKNNVEELHKKNKDIADTDSFVKLGSSIMMTVEGIQALANIPDIFSNEDLSAGEKLLQTVMALTTGIGMLASAVKDFKSADLKGTFTDLVTSFGSKGIGKAVGEKTIAQVGKLGGAIKGLGGVSTTAAAGTATMTSSLAAGAVALGVFAAAAAAVGVAIYAIYRKATEAEREIKALETASDNFSQKVSDLSTTQNELSQSFADYNEMITALYQCEKGSEKWNQALMKVNQTVLEILDKYPEIASIEGVMSTNEDGVLTLDSEKINLFMQSRLKQMERMRLGSQLTQTLADEKSLEEERKDLQSEIDYNSFFGTNTDTLKLEDLQGLDKKDFNKKIDEYVNSVEKEGFQISKSSADYFKNNINELYTEIQNSGNKSQEAANKFKTLSDAIAALELGSDGSITERKIYANQYEDEFKKQYDTEEKWIKDNISRLDGANSDGYKDLLDKLNEATGGNYSAAKGNVIKGWDGEDGITFKDASGENIEFSREELVTLIAENTANKILSDSETGKAAQKINTSIADKIGVSEETADFISTGQFDVNQLTEEQYNSIKDLSDEELTNLLTDEQLKSLGYEGKELGEQFKANFEESLKNWNLDESIENAKQRFSNTIKESATEAEEDYDINAEEFEGYANYIADIADESDELADSLEDDADSTSIVTKSIMRMNQGIEELADNMEDWKDILENSEKTSQEYYEALSGIRSGLADILDVEEEFIDADFITDHLDDIEKASEGNAEAIDRLRDAYADDIVIKIATELKMSEQDKTNFINSINDLQAQIPKLEIGAISNEDFKNQCQNIIDTAGLTVEQANQMFSALGFEAEYTADSETTEVSVPKYKTIEKVTKNNINKKTGEGTIETESYTIPMGTETLKGEQAVGAMSVKTNDGKVNAKKPKITKLTKKASGSFNNYSSSNKGGGSPGKSSGSTKQPDKQDPLKDEKDRYHDINLVLKDIQKNIDKIDKQKEKLFGSELIDNLNQKLQLLNKQIDASNEKIAIAKGEMSELQAKLGAKGVSFGADGYISNYASAYQAQLAYVNSIINQYNNMDAESQEKYKETVEKAKEDFEEFKNNIDKYDQLISDTIPGLESDIQDAIDEKIDIQIEQFTMEIEIRLDMAEAERDWNEFKRKVIDGIKDDDILGNAMARLADFSSYYKDDGTGIVQALEDQINGTLEQLKQMDSKGWSDVYGDNRKQALEDLKTYYDELVSNLTNVEELQEEIHQSYLDMMDEAQEKFDEQIESYETITDLIEHDMNLISLLKGEDSYSELGNYYEKQEENYKKQLDFQKQQVDFWKAQMEAAEEGSEAWEKAKDNWSNAVREWNSAIEASIENLQDKYLNSINEIFDNLNNKVTGGLGLDYVSEQWDLINKNADQYLDTVNSTFEIQKLENKYLDALDNTDSIGARRELKKLMDEELKDLKEKDKLTQYDIDRANMKYEIALKQMALEEAQQNKTTMRLRRDSQGNYSYQYVADDNAIAEAENELNDLYNSLYNFDKDQYQENLNQLYEIWAEFQEKMAEAAQINDPEERAQRELLLQQQYGELINGIVAENTVIRENLTESAFEDLAHLYDMDVSHFQNMSDEEKEILMNDLIPYWSSGIQEMANIFAGEDGFLGVCAEAFDQLHQATKDYEDSLNELEETAGANFDDIINGMDEVISETEDLISDNDELIDSYNREMEAIREVMNQLDQLIQKYTTAKNEAIAATEAAYKYWLQEQSKAANAAGNNVNGGASGSANGNSNGSNSSGSGSGYGAGSGDGQLSIGDTATYTGSYYYDSYGTAPVGSRYSGVAGGIVVDRINNNPYGVHIHSSDGKFRDLGWIKKSQLTGYDTGGYTGDWNDKDGKLALLHQKELVLNQNDTKNILNAVEVLREISSLVNSAISNQISNLALGKGFGNIKENLEQQVHIDANFPNVTNSREIEDAIDNLINVASQRINRR